jgi:hypothetical protein
MFHIYISNYPGDVVPAASAALCRIEARIVGADGGEVASGK